MFNAQSVAAGEDSDDVEAQGVEVRIAVRQVLHGEGANSCLLPWGYGFEWVAESGCAAQFHFHEDEDPFVADNEVDFASARPEVALDEAVASPGQVA